MERGGSRIRFKQGDEVRTVDDQHFGKVVAFLPDMRLPTHLIVERGRLLKRDFLLPVSAVERYAGGVIHLKLTNDDALAVARAEAARGFRRR